MKKLLIIIGLIFLTACGTIQEKTCFIKQGGQSIEFKMTGLNNEIDHIIVKLNVDMDELDSLVNNNQSLTSEILKDIFLNYFDYQDNNAMRIIKDVLLEKYYNLSIEIFPQILIEERIKNPSYFAFDNYSSLLESYGFDCK